MGTEAWTYHKNSPYNLCTALKVLSVNNDLNFVPFLTQNYRRATEHLYEYVIHKSNGPILWYFYGAFASFLIKASVPIGTNCMVHSNQYNSPFVFRGRKKSNVLNDLRVSNWPQHFYKGWKCLSVSGCRSDVISKWHVHVQTSTTHHLQVKSWVCDRGFLCLCSPPGSSAGPLVLWAPSMSTAPLLLPQNLPHDLLCPSLAS